MDKKDIQAFNESLPYGMLPHERIDWLINYYSDLEKKRLEAWEMIQEVRKDVEDSNLKIDETQMTRMINSTATFDGDTLKIVVDDYLPRKCILTNKSSVTPLRIHWLKAITDSIKKLRNTGIDPKFQRAQCIIKIYIPKNIVRDVDNIAYKLVLDGLRYAKIINDDSWEQMSFMVEGGLDRKRPRTEIYVFEHRDMIPEMVTEMIR